MNALDLHVEPWILDPDSPSAFAACDRTSFRRWAIKLAILRSVIDEPRVISLADAASLKAGDDVDSWHVFVGRSHFKDWRHTCAFIGSISPGDGIKAGFIHTSWVIGKAVVSTYKAGKLASKDFLDSFTGYNKHVGEPLAEIVPGSDPLPDICKRNPLGYGQVEPLFWFFTPESVSPVASGMKETYETMRHFTLGRDISARHRAPEIEF